MNGQTARTAVEKSGAARFVGHAAFVAAIAGIILARGISPASAANGQPAAGGSAQQVVIDCKETDKKVKLAPSEGSVTIVFQNCSCWRLKDMPKQYVDWIIGAATARANSANESRSPIIVRADLLPMRSETLTVPLGETKTAEFYCYPKASLDKLDAWSDSLSKPRNQ